MTIYDQGSGVSDGASSGTEGVMKKQARTTGEGVNGQERVLRRIAVLGAGHGGLAMAGHLGLLGYEVSLYNRSPERIFPVENQGGVQLNGEVEGFGPVQVVTTDIGEAISDADLIMVVVPATAHRFFAGLMAPYLKNGQIIILNPGRTGGALEFSTALQAIGCDADVLVGESQTFIYACRSTNPGQVHIFRTKNMIPVAMLPAYRTPEVVRILRQAYPQFVPGDNVIKTGLDNIGAIFHPAITLLNAARIESTHGEFEYYMDGITPSVARILEVMDAERILVAEALGFRAMPAREWLYVAYYAPGGDLYEAIQNNPGYRGIKAPSNVNHRYIWEDVPASLVPIASLGRMLGAPTPCIDDIIHLASILHHRDYWAEGRTVEKLGLAGLSVKDIRRLVLEGIAPTPRMG